MYNNQYYSEFHSSLEQRVLQYQLEKEKEETRIHSLFCKLVPYMHHIGIILKYKENLLNNNIGTFAVAGLVDAVSYLLCLLFI